MAVEAKGNSEKSFNLSKLCREIKAEFKKITWAPKEEVKNTTVVVFTTILMFTAILWVYDSVFGKVLTVLLKQIS